MAGARRGGALVIYRTDNEESYKGAVQYAGAERLYRYKKSVKPPPDE
jgi:hypothetical protein